MGILKIGEIYRYSKKLSPELERVSGYSNFVNVTRAQGLPMPLLERGISPIGMSGKASWERPKPALLVSSSPHKSGSDETPWHDTFDLQNGTIAYYGDNKKLQNPSLPPGNQALVREFAFHSSGDAGARSQASPLIFFLRVPVGSRRKGFVKFVGLGILTTAELTTQYNLSHGFFPNFVFGFKLLSLESEHYQLDWSWINARRSLPAKVSDELAPDSWREWVQSGKVRRPSL